jgi:hypothetical protein
VPEDPVPEVPVPEVPVPDVPAAESVTVSSTIEPPPVPPVPLPVASVPSAAPLVALPVPPPVPPVVAAGGTGATVAGGFGAGAAGVVVVGVVPGVLVVGLVVGAVVVDSTGLVVVALGVGVFDGLAFTPAFFDGALVDSSRGEVRVTAAVRRGSASVTNSAVGVWLGVGAGVGLARGGALSSFSAGSRPGSGRTALERTGPPARLTLIRPPYIMTRAPNAYATRRNSRLRRPVLSTNTGAGEATEITSVSGLSGSADCGFSGSCEVTRRA